MIQQTDSRYYFFGRITFVDIFKKRRWANFCYDYGSAVTIERGKPGISHVGNETSEN
jgi:hypothetical protein